MWEWLLLKSIWVSFSKVDWEPNVRQRNGNNDENVDYMRICRYVTTGVAALRMARPVSRLAAAVVGGAANVLIDSVDSIEKINY